MSIHPIGTNLLDRVGVSDAERRVLRAIRTPISCRGLLGALVLVENALSSYNEAGALQNVSAWLDVVQGLIDRVEALQDEAIGGLQTPIQGDQTTYGRLCAKHPTRLPAKSHVDALTLLGILIVDACAHNEAVSDSAVASWYTLIQGNGKRPTAPADWREVSEVVPIALPDLHAALTQARTPGLITLLSSVIAALSRPIHAPVNTSTNPEIFQAARTGAPASAANSDVAEGSNNDADDPDADDPEARSRDPKNSRGPLDSESARANPVGWLIKCANFARHVQRFDLVGDRDRLHPLSTRKLWLNLKNSFLAGGSHAQCNVSFAHVSQRLALPARIALDLPLDDSRSVRLDVDRGEVHWNYRAALDAAPDPALAALEPRHQPYRIRLRLDADIAAYLRRCLQDRPDATTLAQLLTIDTSPEGGETWMLQYRQYLRDHGEPTHAAYDARFARSLGDAYRHVGANEALAAILALDFVSVPIGMLHYLTLDNSTRATADESLFSFLGWRLPLDGGDPGPQGSPIWISATEFAAGWQRCQVRADIARKALLCAANASDLVDAFNALTTARLVSAITMAAHRGTRLSRLTWRSLYMHAAVIHLYDKDVGDYQSNRCIPVHRLLDHVLAAWQGDLALMRDKARALGITLSQDERRAVPTMTSDEPVFYSLRESHGASTPSVERKALRAKTLEDEAHACFGRPLNIGRHFLMSLLISRNVSAWHVRVLSGHFRIHAEAFSDGSHVPPAHAIDTLRAALEASLDQHDMAPVAGLHPDSPGRVLIARSGSLPDPHTDQYIHPTLTNIFRVLPPPFDEFTTLALSLVDALRADMCRSPDLTPAVEFTAAQTLFAMLDPLDQEVIFGSLDSSVVQLGVVAFAVWERPNSTQPIGMRVHDRSVIALARIVDRKRVGSWRASAEEVGRWARSHSPQLAWPQDNFDAYLALAALALRWRRFHFSPATLTAASPVLPAATFSRRSLLRIAGLDVAPDKQTTLGKAHRRGNTRRVEKESGPLQDVASQLRRVSNIKYPLGGELKRAKEWEDALSDVDLQDDLRALALRRIHQAEIKLWTELDSQADETSTLAGHLPEIITALKLLSPRDDPSEFTSQEWLEWMEHACHVIDEKGRNTKAVKENQVRHFGLKRFTLIARRLGWAVPRGIFGNSGPRVSFDSLRQSAAQVVLLASDYERIFELLFNHFEDWPVLQGRAELAARLLESHPLRSSEQTALVVQCLVHESQMLLIAPGAFSHLKTGHAYRLLECAKQVAALILQAQDGSSACASRYLFLDDAGWDWSDARLIDEATVSAAAQVTGEAAVRKYSFRANVVCRLLWPSWEEVASQVLHAQCSPSAIRGTLNREWSRGFGAVTLAARSAGHGMPLVSLAYYAAAWGFIFSAQGQALLHGLEPDGTLIKSALGSTGSIRSRRAEAKAEGKEFDTWGEVARRCVRRMGLAPLVPTEERAVIAPREQRDDVEPPPLIPCVRLVAQLIAGGQLDELANHLGIAKPLSKRLEALLPDASLSEKIIRRRRGEASSTQVAADRTYMDSKQGRDLLENLVSARPQALHDLLVDLAPYRRNPRDAPPSGAQLLRRIESHLQVLPAPLRLQMRFNVNHGIALAADQLAPFGSRLVIGPTNPRIGGQPQFQVLPAARTCLSGSSGARELEDPGRHAESQLVGRLTIVTRIFLESIEIVFKAL